MGCRKADWEKNKNALGEGMLVGWAASFNSFSFN